LREGLLCLCDEVCRYHREGKICDITLIIGLRIFKVHPVESRQPHNNRNLFGSDLLCRCLVCSHRARHFSFSFAFLGCGAFIVFLFSFRQSKLDLHEVLFSINPKGNECQAVRPNLSDKAFYFIFLDQKPPWTRGIIVRRVARKGIEGNERVCQYEIIAMDRDEAPLEAYVSGFDRFDFVSEESDARLDRFENFIIKPRAFVEGDGWHTRGILPLHSSMKEYLSKARGPRCFEVAFLCLFWGMAGDMLKA